MGEIDLLDGILSPMFVAAGLAGTGIATISILSVGFSDPLVAAEGSEITVVLMLGLAALGAMFATNQVGADDWNNVELGVILLALLLMVAVSLSQLSGSWCMATCLFALPIVSSTPLSTVLSAFGTAPSRQHKDCPIS